MNNKNLNIVCEILKLRCGERLYVREDMKSCAFDNTIVPMYADIKTILRSFFTNADNMIMDMTLFGRIACSITERVCGEFFPTTIFNISFKFH